jgi:hypothetical protein
VPSRRLVRPWAEGALPLRLFYLGTAAPGLSPVFFRPLQTSRLHLPAPPGSSPGQALCSTGITRLRRYYECSDSCAWMCVWLTQPGTHPLLAAAQVSPRHGHHLLGSPSPITPPPPPIALSPVLSASQASRSSRVWASIGGSPVGTAESSSCHYGLPVRLALLPIPSRDDAVTVGYRTETGIPEGDLHLSDVARLWTHDGRDKPGHDVSRGGAPLP